MGAAFDAITGWDNLCRAYRLAARGKRRTGSAAAFEHQLADRLIALQSELRLKTYRPGAYRHFFIHEPKRRKISAASFRDRVVHHALCNVIEPVFDTRFIAHSYANRAGKGTHRAVDQLQAWARRYRYVLRADVVQHFASLDHAILCAKLTRLIDDVDVLWLAAAILGSGAAALVDEYTPVYFPGDDLLAVCRPRGLPIGNLTSQFWSNVYMNDFDWFVLRDLGCGAYLRYVDDITLFSDKKTKLWAWKEAMIARLGHERLTIHEAQAQILPTHCGIPWLGFVVYPTHRLLKRRNAVNFTRRLESNLDRYQTGQISFAELDAGAQGWINHVRYADTWGLREYVFATHPIPRRAAPQKIFVAGEVSPAPPPEAEDQSF
ncbi:MAG: reverse transcriptase domain-containing protein [Gammaproteobacteria bacterium]